MPRFQLTIIMTSGGGPFEAEEVRMIADDIIATLQEHFPCPGFKFRLSEGKEKSDARRHHHQRR
jgi:hypothetical protein